MGTLRASIVFFLTFSREDKREFSLLMVTFDIQKSL